MIQKHFLFLLSIQNVKNCLKEIQSKFCFGMVCKHQSFIESSDQQIRDAMRKKYQIGLTQQCFYPLL